jgi:hypothetical protein
MCFYSPARHFELRRDFGIVTTLQEQFDDLLFPRPQPNHLLPHKLPLVFHGVLLGWDFNLSKRHSIRFAILRRVQSIIRKILFHSDLETQKRNPRIDNEFPKLSDRSHQPMTGRVLAPKTRMEIGEIMTSDPSGWA